MTGNLLELAVAEVLVAEQAVGLVVALAVEVELVGAEQVVEPEVAVAELERWFLRALQKSQNANTQSSRAYHPNLNRNSQQNHCHHRLRTVRAEKSELNR